MDIKRSLRSMIQSCVETLTPQRTPKRIPGKVVFTFEQTLAGHPTGNYVVLIDLGEKLQTSDRFRLFRGPVGNIRELMLGHVHVSDGLIELYTSSDVKSETELNTPPADTGCEAMNNVLDWYHELRSGERYRYEVANYNRPRRYLHISPSWEDVHGVHCPTRPKFTTGRFIKNIDNHSIEPEIYQFFDPSTRLQNMMNVNSL